MRAKPPRLSSRSFANAFSLIEIVLALGVISFALVGILGLFPVALQAATNSQRETHAALIAKSIYSDLQTQTGIKRFLLLGKDTTPDNASASGNEASRYANKIEVDLSGGETKSYYLAYDSEGQPLEEKASTGEYKSGSLKAAYLAKLTIAPSNNSESIFQMEIVVGAPGAAPLTNRGSYLFVSLVYDGKTTQ